MSTLESLLRAGRPLEETAPAPDPSISWQALIAGAVSAQAAAEPMEFGEPLVFGPEPGAGPCTGAVIFLHGLADTPKSWGTTLKKVRNNTAIAARNWKWVHLRARKLAQPCYSGKKVHAWGKFQSTECMHLGSRDYEDPDAEGFYKAASAGVRRVVETLTQADGVPEDSIFIGGFSQGAAVALQTALTFPTLFAGCFVLSGWITPHARSLLAGRSAASAPSILICHGTKDELVGYDCAQATVLYLKQAEARFQFETFNGLGHTSSPEELQIVAQFLLRIMASASGSAIGENRLAAAKAAAAEVSTRLTVGHATQSESPATSVAAGATVTAAAGTAAAAQVSTPQSSLTSVHNSTGAGTPNPAAMAAEMAQMFQTLSQQWAAFQNSSRTSTSSSATASVVPQVSQSPFLDFASFHGDQALATSETNASDPKRRRMS